RAPFPHLVSKDRVPAKAETHRSAPNVLKNGSRLSPGRRFRPKSIEVRTPQFVFPGRGPGTHERLLVDGRAKPGQDAVGVVRFNRIMLSLGTEDLTCSIAGSARTGTNTAVDTRSSAPRSNRNR